MDFAVCSNMFVESEKDTVGLELKEIDKRESVLLKRKQIDYPKDATCDALLYLIENKKVDRRFFGLYDGGLLCGFLVVRLLREDRSWLVDRFFLDNGHRRDGYAVRALLLLIAFAKEQNTTTGGRGNEFACSKIYAETVRGDVHLEADYRSVGFEKVREDYDEDDILLHVKNVE